MLTHELMDAKLDEHFGFEARDDVEGVLSTLTENVEHDIVGWPPGPSHGPDQARAFYENLFADLADGKVETERTPPPGEPCADKMEVRVLQMVSAIDATEQATRQPDGTVKLAGDLRSVTLDPQ